MSSAADAAAAAASESGRGLDHEELDLESGLPPHSKPPLGGTSERRLKLYEAAVTGDWNIAEAIFKDHPDEIRAPITKRGETALHISALAEQTHFVLQLLDKMSPDDLALTDKAGNTAFAHVAITKKLELADAMLKTNKGLAMIRRHKDKMLPLTMAVRLGHREMVLHLYKDTKNKLDDDDRKNLVIPLIEADIYDVALDILKEHGSLAAVKYANGETALHALARKSHVLSNVAIQSFPGIRRSIYLFAGSNEAQNQKLMQRQALELVQLIWDHVKQLDDSSITNLIGSHWQPIFIAAEQGNLEFLRILIRAYPDIVFKLNDESQTIFHIAVLHRHESVFKLIHEIGSIKNLLGMYKDKKRNNMLHLAGKKAPTNRLNVVAGAALQLQRELLWFEEVKKVVRPHLFEAKNDAGTTPEGLFLDEHMDMMNKGEKWMRGTANSCTLVATLIATVVFAAAFTVPGGNGPEGIPIVMNEAAFKVFAVSDAVSLIFSASSVLTFLSILTSRYRLDDFMWSLPNRLIVGLTTLFISMVAMMVAFIAAFFIVFQHGLLRFAIPIAAISPVPIVLFIWLHCRLFLDVIKSTYLHRSLFRPNRKPLFHARDNPKFLPYWRAKLLSLMPSFHFQRGSRFCFRKLK